jgi:predicted phage-related endonuclease
MIIYHDVKQGSKEWYQLRAPLWTGSKAIKLLQGKPLPREYDFGGNIHTRRGHALEPVAIAEYERQVGRKVTRPGFVTNTVYPNAGYSPDGIQDKVLLEVKALNGKRHEKLAGGDIPLEFLVQIYFGMIITGLRQAKLLAFNPEYEHQLTIMFVHYDKVIGNNIRSKLKLDMKKRSSG